MEFPNFVADLGVKPDPRMSIERLDNEKGYELANCKWATKEEQCKNHRKQKRNTSGAVGVYRSGKRWMARISVDKKVIQLGSYPSFEEAVAVRRSAARHYGFKTDLAV